MLGSPAEPFHSQLPRKRGLARAELFSARACLFLVPKQNGQTNGDRHDLPLHSRYEPVPVSSPKVENEPTLDSPGRTRSSRAREEIASRGFTPSKGPWARVHDRNSRSSPVQWGEIVDEVDQFASPRWPRIGIYRPQRLPFRVERHWPGIMC